MYMYLSYSSKGANTVSRISTSFSHHAVTNAVSVDSMYRRFHTRNTRRFPVLADEFIIGRVIKAMNASWHPECFLCEICGTCLADSGYFKNAGRALCKPCNDRENAAGRGKHWCYKCQ